MTGKVVLDRAKATYFKEQKQIECNFPMIFR